MRITHSSLCALSLLAGSTALAQSFSLSTLPRLQSFPAGNNATYTVTFAPLGGFSATINFEVYARSLPYHAVQLSATKINSPYQTITVTVNPQSGHITGKHMIVMHGWNGPAHAYDTVFLEVPPTRGWAHYHASNSPLPSNGINGMVLDKDGVAWIATDEGLARFDKENWRIYTHMDFGGFSDDVVSVAADSSNAIWITVQDSTAIARFKDGEWSNWNMLASKDTIEQMRRTYDWPVVSLAAAPNGTIWGVLDKRLVRFEDGVWIGYNGQSVESIVIDQNNAVWSALRSDFVVKFDGTFWSTDLFTPPSRLHALAVAPDNSIWALGRDGIIRHGQDSTYYITNGTREFPGPHPHSVAFDNRGHIWVGSADPLGAEFSYGEGIVRYDGVVTTRFSVHNSGLPDNRVRTVKAGPDGTIWMRTEAPGIVLFDPEIATSVERAATAGAIGIKAISPNPINDRGAITLTIPRREEVRLTLHNTLGEEVAAVFNGTLDAGEKIVPISAGNLPSGTYFLRVAVGSAFLAQTLVISH